MNNKKEKLQYYNIAPLLKCGCIYNMIIGERSNGKSYQVNKTNVYGCDEADIKGYIQGGGQFAYVRRHKEDIAPRFASSILEPFVLSGDIEKWTKGKYNNYIYKSYMWYLVHRDETGEIDAVDDTPCGYAFALSLEQSYKSNSYINVTKIFLEEFLSRDFYLSNEFILFMSIVSTIVRQRDNVLIFMCGNTVNQYCPYFDEMGINPRNQKKGTIDIYTYGDSGLTLACEYSDFPSKKKPSDKYFAFGNERLNMITQGSWEIALYPHCPIKIKPKDILYKFYIVYHENTLQCEVIYTEDNNFIFIHRKTTPIKIDYDTLVYTLVTNSNIHYRNNLTKAYTPLEQNILLLFKQGKIFYDTNNTGEIVRNFLADSK